jgi:DNA-binding IclR family transcriptional regulator
MLKKPPIYKIKILDKSLDILENFYKKDSTLTITELSEILKTYPSTIHRVLETLKYRGYVEQDPVSKKYFLGLKLVELGKYKMNKLDLAKIAYPFLNEIVDQFNENAYLCVYSNEKVLYLEKVESTHMVTMSTHIGATAPLHCTALGKILLTSLSKEELNKILSKSKLKRFTEKTITNKKLLKAEINKVKMQGFAFDFSEYEKDVCCMATSILDYQGKIIGAISVSLPNYRLDSKTTLNNIKEVVIQKGKEISAKMGYEVLKT